MTEEKHPRTDAIEEAYDAVMDIFESIEPMEAIGIMAFCVANIARNASTIEGENISIKQLCLDLTSIALKVPTKAKLKYNDDKIVLN